MRSTTPSQELAGRIDRLSPTDQMFLRLETAAWPCHFGGLAVLEGSELVDGSGVLRMGEIKDRLELRVARVPDLRQRVHFPGPLQGRALWVDDDEFAIDHHVYERAVDPPGGHAQLLAAAAECCEGLLDRRRPLWELWFLTGLSGGRLGVLLKLHHAMADGLAAVAIMGSLFDLEPDAPEPPIAPWAPRPFPDGGTLVVANLSGKARTVGRAIAALAHPRHLLSRTGAFVRMTGHYFGKRAAPASSINQPVRAGRQVRSLRLDLSQMKEIAHVRGGKINDAVLTLWAGGLRRLLGSRGEPVADVELITGVATSLRSDSGAIDNQVGTMVLPVPIGEADPHRRLDLIVQTTRMAKAEQRPAATMGYLAGLAATPIGRYFTAHQRAANVILTNVKGPPVPVYLLGARVLDVLPIIELVGNIGLTMCAFSYAGQISLVVTADATAFPDLDTLMEGMEAEWRGLRRSIQDARLQ